MKHSKFFACVILFFTCVVNIKAEYKWVKIYDYETDNYENVVEYHDQTYLPLSEDSANLMMNFLNPGETYILKVFYGNSGILNIDSCYTAYNYIPESYQEDGFWTYANYGILADPSGYYGIYNIALTEPLPIEWGEDSEYSEEEAMGIIVQSDKYFIIEETGLTYLRFEIYAYRDVEE